MIKYLQHTEINQQKWDACIAHSFNGIVYAYSWYLNVVNEGWEALVEGDYKAVMPLTKANKMGLDYLYQPFFTQQLGVFSVDKINEKVVDDFLNAIPKKFSFVEINVNTFNKVISSEYTIKSNVTHELDLINSYENLYQKFSDNTKRNIKKAIQHKLELNGEITVDAMIDMFRANRGKSIKNLRDADYDMLKRLITNCLQQKRGQIRAVFSAEKKMLACAFFVESNGKVIFLFSASNEEAKQTGAMPFLIDRFIYDNSQRNLVFDFEGSNHPDLARFYKSFGSTECIYLQIRKNKLPFFLRWIKG
ncbi:MAG: GNAT family N-acetyltransferase [Bacteroidia bacterium]